MRDIICDHCGASYLSNEYEQLSDSKCVYCGNRIKNSKSVDFKKIRTTNILFTFFIFLLMIFVAGITAQNVSHIIFAGLTGSVLGLLLLIFKKYNFIEVFTPLISFLPVILLIMLCIMGFMDLDHSSWFSNVILLNFGMILFAIVISIGFTKSKAEVGAELVGKTMKDLDLEGSSEFNDLLCEMDVLKNDEFYFQFIQQNFVKKTADTSNQGIGKNNLIKILDKMNLYPVPLTGEFVGELQIESMYLFLEKLYLLRKGKELDETDFHALYFNRIDESIIFSLDNFDKVKKVPLVTLDYLTEISQVKWTGANEKFLKKLSELKYGTLDYEYPELTTFRAQEKNFMKFLAACSAVKNSRGYLENVDFITAYKTYFKIIKTDLTRLKPVEIEEIKETSQYPLFRGNINLGRYLYMGIIVMLFLTKYNTLFSQYPLLTIILPFITIITVSYLSTDEYIPGISTGIFIGIIGSFPAIFSGFEKFMAIVLLYSTLGVIGGFIGSLLKRMKTGKFRASPQEMDMKKRIGKGYLVCKKCGDYYKLQPWESPEDFSTCQCGGEIEYKTRL